MPVEKLPLWTRFWTRYRQRCVEQEAWTWISRRAEQVKKKEDVLLRQIKEAVARVDDRMITHPTELQGEDAETLGRYGAAVGGQMLSQKFLVSQPSQFGFVVLGCILCSPNQKMDQIYRLR